MGEVKCNNPGSQSTNLSSIRECSLLLIRNILDGTMFLQAQTQSSRPNLLLLQSNLIFSPHLFLNPLPPSPPQNSGPQSMWIEFQNMEGRGERGVGEGGMRRRSHSSHFLTEGDKNILAEWKTMDVRQVRGSELTAAVVGAESRDGAGTCRRGTTGGLAARPGGVSARVHITATLVTPQANTRPRSFEVRAKAESVQFGVIKYTEKTVCGL